jgi:hypothetical protein|uniref:MYM-type domain-containing protein n=1 Tax=viral metagenome TaxID=1070528 RepID=A0A6C0JUZ4_9ZZZZ
MPRKKKVQDISEKEIPKKNKKNIMTTMVIEENKDDEHIILQLPLNENKLDSIINKDKNRSEPIPYEKDSIFDSDNKVIEKTYYEINANKLEENKNEYTNNESSKTVCFWCVFLCDYKVYGMPVNYDISSNTYICYGSFCSLQCANAYNFSTNSGSDKVWEINSLIQMMGKIYNYELPIRPAPSKYLLNIFSGGKLTIEEYRNLHKNSDTSHVLNLPPMINISSTYEVINTSYIKTLSDNMKNSVITSQLNQIDAEKKDNVFDKLIK